MGGFSSPQSEPKPESHDNLYAYAGGRNKYGLPVHEGPVFTVDDKGEILTGRETKEKLLSIYKRAEVLLAQLRRTNLKLKVADSQLRKKVGDSIAEQLNLMVKEKRNMLNPYYTILFYERLFAYYSNEEGGFFDLSPEEFEALDEKIETMFTFLRFNKKGERLLLPVHFLVDFFSANRDLLNLSDDKIHDKLLVAVSQLPPENFKQESEAPEESSSVLVADSGTEEKMPSKQA